MHEVAYVVMAQSGSDREIWHPALVSLGARPSWLACARAAYGWCEDFCGGCVRDAFDKGTWLEGEMWTIVEVPLQDANESRLAT